MKLAEEFFPSEEQLVVLKQALAVAWRSEHEGSELRVEHEISGDEITFSWESWKHPVAA